MTNPRKATPMTTQATGSHAAAADTYVSTTQGMERISSPMVAALEQAWNAIRARHGDVPPAVVVLGAGSIGAPAGMLRLGHFAATRWNTNDAADFERLAEVFVGGEGLVGGPVDVLATLLHEAAHAIAHVRGIGDTSRQGRWHNARFKALAEEVGIEGHALRLPRMPEAVRRGGRKSSNNATACVCGCGRRIRVAPTVFAVGPITCGLCSADFEPAEPSAVSVPSALPFPRGRARACRVARRRI